MLPVDLDRSRPISDQKCWINVLGSSRQVRRPEEDHALWVQYLDREDAADSANAGDRVFDLLIGRNPSPRRSLVNDGNDAAR
jgi:hypothetical protein